MSFGVKSLLTPDKVGPREASGKVIPWSPGLVEAEPLSGSPRVGFLSYVLYDLNNNTVYHLSDQGFGSPSWFLLARDQWCRQPQGFPGALGLVSAMKDVCRSLGVQHSWTRRAGWSQPLT